MPKLNFSSINKFYRSISRLDPPHKLLFFSFAILAFLYPGQNRLQTMEIHPGEVLSYTTPALDLAAYPQWDQQAAPAVSSAAVIIQDIGSKSILYSYGEDQELLPASTTKLMTALVALDLYSLDEVITITKEDHAVGHTMNLAAGETLIVRDLLYGILVESGNDAALALASHHPEGYDGFIQAMNDKAQSLHLDHTSYRNPSGVESYNHYTSARDLATLASAAASDPLIVEIVGTREITVADSTLGITHRLVNTNELLGELNGVRGMKTGWTEHAGECLVTWVERAGRGVIIVVLGSSDRFGDSAKLVDWIYAHHTWVNPH